MSGNPACWGWLVIAIAITVPDSLIDVSNGRLRSTTKTPDGATTYEWFVTSPINNYDVTINAGRYAHFSDTLNGEAGRLTLDFWPLDYHADTARRQFQQVIPMLRCSGLKLSSQLRNIAPVAAKILRKTVIRSISARRPWSASLMTSSRTSWRQPS